MKSFIFPLLLALLALSPESSFAENYSTGELTAADHEVLARRWGTTDYEVFARIVTRTHRSRATGLRGGAPTINDSFLAFVCLERNRVDGDNRCESGFFKHFESANSGSVERGESPLRGFSEAIEAVQSLRPWRIARPRYADLYPSFNVSRRAGVQLIFFLGVAIIPVDILTSPFQLMVYGGSIFHARAQVRRMKRSVLDFIRTGDRDGTRRLGSFVDLTRVATQLDPSLDPQ